MVDQICMRTDYFLVFVILTLGIIAWVIYQLMNHYQQLTTANTDKLDDLYENLASITKDQKDKDTEKSKIDSQQSQPNLQPYLRHTYSQPVANYNVPPIMPYGTYGGYQLVGYVYPHNDPDQMFRLMGRQYNNTRYEYYVIHPFTDIKIPIKVKNDWELNTGDHVHIQGFHGHYVVKIYDDDDHFF